jgi:hypothetical protein
MQVVLDDSAWPLVVVRFEGFLNDADFDDYLTRYARVVSRGPYAAVLDATSGWSPSLSQQRRQAAWMKEHRAVIAQNSRGTAFVITSPAVRFALSAIFAITRMPGPYTVVATYEEAREYCLRSLRQARAPLRA